MNDQPSWGSAMAALTELQRRYVMAMAADPFGNPTAWSRAAGYSDVKDRAKVTGHFNSHNPKIEAAVQEYARQTLFTEGPMLAAAGLLRIARDKDHPKHMRAIETLANRVGLHETTEHHVTVTRQLSDEEKIERIKALAAKHGMDPATLLGGNAALPAPIEGEFKVVSDAAG